MPLPAAPTTPAAATTVSCPRCHKPLIDPDGLGWCKACGYCRSLEVEQHNQLLQEARQPSHGEVFAGAAGQIPWWFWVLVIGVGVLAAAALAAGKWLPAGNNLPRALFASVQIVLGLVLIFAAQLYALVRVAPDDERLNFKDALVPTRLWILVGKRLSQLYGCLWTAVWGLALIVFAFLFIGGLQHWMSYLPGANKDQNKQRTPPPRVWQ